MTYPVKEVTKGGHYDQGRTGHITQWQQFLFFLGPLKQNPTKIWGANPPLTVTNKTIYDHFVTRYLLSNAKKSKKKTFKKIA
jgi:hypothetical protein